MYTQKKKNERGNIFGDMEQNREESWFLSVSHFPQELQQSKPELPISGPF